ncbi:MAG TPA: protein kinase, partial [Myxococcota bacterium]|nr:protein kinase [Myxococcota bacterium]
RFKREVLLARSVSHPGICRVFDLHEHEGTHFITMEHIDGESLERLLQDEGVLPIAHVVRIGRGIAMALAAAHQAGIVHRDLKPSNVLIAHNGKPSLLDFGFATTPTLTSLTTPGFIVGSLHYVAPETLRGEVLSESSDVYALGVLLYRCVTGLHPHEAADVTELLELIETRRAMPPSQYNSQSFPELDELILRTIAAPAERFHSALEVERELAALETDTLTKVERARPLSPWDRDIDSLVSLAIQSPTYSSLLQQKVSHTTVLFTDIVGATSYFDRHGDVRGYRFIDTHNKLLLPIVESHGGVVIKTIGDAIMATFARADGAASAAIAMQEALARHNASIHDSGGRISVRIGIHSGQAVVQRSDVFGNCVNVAARICALAEGGDILVSSSTRDMLLDPKLVTEFHSSPELKGKQGSYALFSVTWDDDTQVTERSPPPSRETPAPSPLQSRPPIVGRTRVAWFIMAAALGLLFTAGALTMWFDVGDQPEPELTSAATPEAAPIADVPLEPPTPVPPSAPPPAPPLAPPAPPPKPAIAVKSTTTSRPPRGGSGRKTVSDADRTHAELTRLATDTAAAVRGHGLVDGDVAQLDEAQRDLQRAVRGGDGEHARDAAARAVAIASHQAIDRTFISRKLTRLNGRYDTISKGGVVPKLDDALASAAAAFAHGDFRGANGAL